MSAPPNLPGLFTGTKFCRVGFNPPIRWMVGWNPPYKKPCSAGSKIRTSRPPGHLNTGRAGRWRFCAGCAKVRLGAQRLPFQCACSAYSLVKERPLRQHRAAIDASARLSSITTGAAPPAASLARTAGAKIPHGLRKTTIQIPDFIFCACHFCNVFRAPPSLPGVKALL